MSTSHPKSMAARGLAFSFCMGGTVFHCRTDWTFGEIEYWTAVLTEGRLYARVYRYQSVTDGMDTSRRDIGDVVEHHDRCALGICHALARRAAADLLSG